MKAIEAMREAIARSGDGATMRRHFHTWFDAFRTLKLVHALRDAGLPSMPWRQALAEAPFAGLSASTQDEPEPLRTRARRRGAHARRQPRRAFSRVDGAGARAARVPAGAAPSRRLRRPGLAAPELTAKTESSFSSFALRQAGHRGFASPRTNSSKRFSHARHRYS